MSCVCVFLPHDKIGYFMSQFLDSEDNFLTVDLCFIPDAKLFAAAKINSTSDIERYAWPHMYTSAHVHTHTHTCTQNKTDFISPGTYELNLVAIT